MYTDDTLIENTPLHGWMSVRLYNILANEHITTIGHLRRLTRKEFLGFKNAGKLTLREAADLMMKVGVPMHSSCYSDEVRYQLEIVEKTRRDANQDSTRDKLKLPTANKVVQIAFCRDEVWIVTDAGDIYWTYRRLLVGSHEPLWEKATLPWEELS